jgi:hypothetical protein
MSDIAIRVENLSKLYPSTSQRTLRSGQAISAAPMLRLRSCFDFAHASTSLMLRLRSCFDFAHASTSLSSATTLLRLAFATQNAAQDRHFGWRSQPRTPLSASLRDALVDLNPLPRILRLRSGQVSRIIRKGNSKNSSNSWQNDTLWALKDVSFEACPELQRRAQRGEVVGIPSIALRAGPSTGSG